jgi:hypothetical protein
VDAAGIEQNPLAERGFAGVDMGRNADVTQVLQFHDDKPLSLARAAMPGRDNNLSSKIPWCGSADLLYPDWSIGRQSNRSSALAANKTLVGSHTCQPAKNPSRHRLRCGLARGRDRSITHPTQFPLGEKANFGAECEFLTCFLLANRGLNVENGIRPIETFDWDSQQ